MSKRIYGKKMFAVMGGTLLIAAAILIIIFLLHGQTVVRREYPEKQKNTTLVCVNENVVYPILEDDGKNAKLRISMIFVNNEYSSISLIYSKSYPNNTMANQALARIMANMNESFGVEFGADAFNANYSVNENIAQMTLYLSNKLEDHARKYFLVDGSSHYLDDYQKNYTSQNFKCEIK